jgi:hypothetical protein
MNNSDEKKASMKKLVIIVSVFLVTAMVVMVGMRISDGLIAKSRLSAAIQTLKSTAGVMAACQINNVAIFSPDSARAPQNAPCVEVDRYATLDKNATKNCLYNTTFVPTVSQAVVAGGAIQAGCNCSGADISTCKAVFQCDFATTGQCSTKIIEK